MDGGITLCHYCLVIPVVVLTANSNEDARDRDYFKVAVGSNDTLVCMVTAVPLPDFTEIAILANGSREAVIVETLPSSDGMVRLVANLDTQAQEGNGTVYECVANNIIGTGRDTIVQVVQGN